MNPLHIALIFVILILAFGVATVLLNSAKLNLQASLDREQEAHRGAKLINTALQKSLSAKNAEMVKKDHEIIKLKQAGIAATNSGQGLAEIAKELHQRVKEAENQANRHKAEFIAVSNELEATKAKVRKRDANGKFLPSGNARPKRVKKVKAAIEVESPKLVHGLTVKNPTESEAKMIFDEAKRLGLRIHAMERIAADLPHIWFAPNDTVSRCIIGALQRQYVTAKEFVQRMQNGRG